MKAICPSKYRESKLETLLEQITALARLAGDYAAVYVFLSERRNAERRGTGCGSWCAESRNLVAKLLPFTAQPLFMRTDFIMAKCAAKRERGASGRARSLGLLP